ncbi:hypothetical protein ACFE04_028123 [Oxalis oulophora]
MKMMKMLLLLLPRVLYSLLFVLLIILTLEFGGVMEIVRGVMDKNYDLQLHGSLIDLLALSLISLSIWELEAGKGVRGADVRSLRGGFQNQVEKAVLGADACSPRGGFFRTRNPYLSLSLSRGSLLVS